MVLVKATTSPFVALPFTKRIPSAVGVAIARSSASESESYSSGKAAGAGACGSSSELSGSGTRSSWLPKRFCARGRSETCSAVCGSACDGALGVGGVSTATSGVW